MSPTSRPSVAAVVLLGPTGAGKTPYGEYIQRIGFCGRAAVHLDFGEELRQIAAADSPAADLSDTQVQTIRRVLSSGALLESSDAPIISTILGGFIRAADAEQAVLVLNGIPRSSKQATEIISQVDVQWVISFECDATTVMARIALDSGGDRGSREDDGVALVTRKLETYRARTRPLLENFAATDAQIVKVPIRVETQPPDVARMVARVLGGPVAPSTSVTGTGEILTTAADVHAAMSGHAGTWQLSSADIIAIERLPAIYALCFDSGRSELAAELFTEDAVTIGLGPKPSVGKRAIARGFAAQAKLRAAGKMRLRSRHHMGNVVIRPLSDRPGECTCQVYMVNYRNPDSDHPFNDGPPEELFAPAFVSEYRFMVRREQEDEEEEASSAGFVWKISRWELQTHFGRRGITVGGRAVGATSSLPDAKL